MWPFDRFRRPPAVELPPELVQLDAYLRRLGELEVKLAQLSAVRLEWIDYEDRLTRLTAKLDKRDERAAKKKQQPDDRDLVEEGRRLFNERFGPLARGTNNGGSS